MTAVHAAAVALAGMLAEATAVLHGTNAGASIPVDDRLMAEIERAVGLVPAMGDEPIPASIPTSSMVQLVRRVPAKLTVEDAEFLGDDVLTAAQLKQAATKALFHVNDGSDWQQIVKTANELMAIEPERLTGYAAFLDGD
ncbi:hypothetical protein ACYOEI_05440 [Singulisphaera rosea]